MGIRTAELFKGRRFGPRMRQALELVAAGCSVRMAAWTAGLRGWQDVAKQAQALGIGRRRMARAESPREKRSAA